MHDAAALQTTSDNAAGTASARARTISAVAGASSMYSSHFAAVTACFPVGYEP